MEIANAVVLSASEGWAGVWLGALVVILMITRRTCHNDDHVLGVGVRLVVLRSRDACLVHLLGDGIVRNVSVVVVDLFKEEKERRHGGVSNDDREGGRGEAIVAPLAKWPK